MSLTKFAETIKYVCRKKETVTNVLGDKFEVFPAFPVSGDSPKMESLALRWASGQHWHNTGYSHDHTDELPNDLFHDILIIDLVRRREGGRAFKGIVHGKYLVDLREDVMVTSMLKYGCTPGGRLTGNFIWGQSGSQMRIEEYDAKAVAASRISKSEKAKAARKKTIPMSKLEYGGVYSDGAKLPNYYVFIGVAVKGKKKVLLVQRIYLSEKNLTQANYDKYNNDIKNQRAPGRERWHIYGHTYDQQVNLWNKRMQRLTTTFVSSPCVNKVAQFNPHFEYVDLVFSNQHGELTEYDYLIVDGKEIR